MDAIYSSMSFNLMLYHSLPGAQLGYWTPPKTHCRHKTPSASPLIWCSEVKDMLKLLLITKDLVEFYNKPALGQYVLATFLLG